MVCDRIHGAAAFFFMCFRIGACLSRYRFVPSDMPVYTSLPKHGCSRYAQREFGEYSAFVYELPRDEYFGIDLQSSGTRNHAVGKGINDTVGMKDQSILSGQRLCRYPKSSREMQGGKQVEIPRRLRLNTPDVVHPNNAHIQSIGMIPDRSNHICLHGMSG